MSASPRGARSCAMSELLLNACLTIAEGVTYGRRSVPNYAQKAIIRDDDSILADSCAHNGHAGDTETAATTSKASGGPTSDSAGPAETPAPDVSVGETIIEISVSGGVVSPEARQVAVPMGNTVRLLVTSDVADEVHVHGYELTLDLAPGAQAELTFLAEIPGIFEAELHEDGQQLFELRVE